MLKKLTPVARQCYRTADWPAVLAARQPVLFPGALPVRACQWPADAFARLAPFADRTVAVELTRGGASYADADADAGTDVDGGDAFQRVEMPLGVLTGFLTHAASADTNATSASASAPQNTRSAKAESRMSVYMAQHALFDGVPELYDDVSHHDSFVEHRGKRVPAAVAAGRGDLYNVNAWIGTATHTPLHHDPYNNLYLQLFGRKRIVLFPKSLAGALGMHTSRQLTNTSTIRDVFDSSTRLDDDLLAAGLQEELNPGDLVCIPQGWLHSLKGDDGVTGSVNWWFR